MNRLGVSGCRAKIDELAQELREKAAEYGWTEQTIARLQLGRPMARAG